MVVLEAAAITAGGVAAYKGGKAAATATAKSVKTKLKLSNQEKDRKETYDSRKQERKERFSKINDYRTSLKDVNGSNKRGGGLVPNFNWKQDKSSSTSRTASSATYSTQSSSGSWWEKM
ncbi:hypothetical protein ACHAXR_007379 [Thalassiosira sp. AJA248-18]